MTDLVTALGLVFVIEGVLYGAFPHMGRRIGEFLRTAPDDLLRMAGLASAAVGLAIVWFSRSVL